MKKFIDNIGAVLLFIPTLVIVLFYKYNEKKSIYREDCKAVYNP